MFDGVAYGTLYFHGICYALRLSQFLFQHLGFFVLDDFLREIFFHILHRAVTFLVYTGKDGHKHVVVLTTFVKRRYIAYFGVFIEYPSHGFTRVAYSSYIMFIVEQVFALL